MITDSHWQELTQAIQKQVKCNTVRMHEGGVDTVLQQLQRGDQFPTSRRAAWYHVMLEVEIGKAEKGSLPFTFQAENYPRCRKFNLQEPCANSFESEKQLPPLLEPVGGGGAAACHGLKASKPFHNNHLVMGSNQSQAETSSTDARGSSDGTGTQQSPRPRSPPALVGEEPLSDISVVNDETPKEVIARLENKKPLSMLERQELWLAKKVIKAEAKVKAAKDEELSRMRTGPNLSLSRQSFSRQKHRSSMKENVPSRKQRKRSKKEKKVRVEQTAYDSSFADNNKAKREDGKREPDNKHASTKQQAQGPAHLSASEQSKIKACGEIDYDGPGNTHPEAIEAQNASATDSMTDKSEQQSHSDASQIKSDAVSSEIRDMPVLFSHDEENNRKSIRIREMNLFKPSTIYKKRDRRSGRGSSIAIVIGRYQSPPHQEKTIEVCFDMDELTEAQAVEWWRKNRYRFE